MSDDDDDEVGRAVRDFNEKYKNSTMEQRKRFWLKHLDMSHEENQEFIRKNFGEID